MGSAQLHGQQGQRPWGGVLGLETGIVQAPLGPDIGGPALVAAVANAGGLGILRAPHIKDRPDLFTKMVEHTRQLTSKPFGVGVNLAFPYATIVQAIYAEKVQFMQVNWGEFPRASVDQAHRAGVKVLHQVGSVDAALKAAEAGVDAIIVQGIEAGGHVLGQTGLLTLLPSVVDAVKGFNIPVIAAGGIVDGRGYVAALALGAQGICMGTRFAATTESTAHPLYKKMILESGSDGTEHTDMFGRGRWPGALHRVLKTPFFETWKNKLAADDTEFGQPTLGRTTMFENVEEDVPRFSAIPPNSTTQGDVASMVMYAGTGASHIKEVLPTATVVRSILEETQTIIEQRLRGLLEIQPKQRASTTV